MFELSPSHSLSISATWQINEKPSLSDTLAEENSHIGVAIREKGTDRKQSSDCKIWLNNKTM